MEVEGQRIVTFEEGFRSGLLIGRDMRKVSGVRVMFCFLFWDTVT
jgi:hypothetical protein